MSEEAIRQTKALARWAVLYIAAYIIYSAFEVVRHLIVDGVVYHVAGHAAVLCLFCWILSQFPSAAIQLFFKSARRNHETD